MHSTTTNESMTGARRLLNRVPEITLYFWAIKIMATTVGETAADYLSGHLGLGLSKTTLVMLVGLVAALGWQLTRRRYIAAPYWFAVTMVSVVGTLITDNLTDKFGVSLYASTLGFSLLLAAVFAAWYATERTLSIHTVYTGRREAFYWSAILATFALGTAAGDLLSEEIGLGYLTTGAIFAAGIAVVAIAWKLGANAVAAFWAAYIMTRPLGASLGDLLSQPHHNGGLGLGTTNTSLVFLGVIVALVGYLAVTKVDHTEHLRLATPDVADQ